MVLKKVYNALMILFSIENHDSLLQSESQLSTYKKLQSRKEQFGDSPPGSVDSGT